MCVCVCVCDAVLSRGPQRRSAYDFQVAYVCEDSSDESWQKQTGVAQCHLRWRHHVDGEVDRVAQWRVVLVGAQWLELTQRLPRLLGWTSSIRNQPQWRVTRHLSSEERSQWLGHQTKPTHTDRQTDRHTAVYTSTWGRQCLSRQIAVLYCIATVL